MDSVIDLRSDTVTKPTAAMRAAMANAEVGDDVYGEDPTVNELERRAAEMLGREAAIYVPTGSMGNQIALRLHTQPGNEVVCEANAHVIDWEMGMAAMFSGCQLRVVQGARGVLRWSDIEPMLKTAGLYYQSQTGLVWIENTHNMAGGTVTPVAVMNEIAEGAHARGLPVHLDGARVFNAAVAAGVDVATLTRGFDTVNFCLSKGLCAPVGSILTGTTAMMARARVVRKALGGGMRQVGIMAAAALIALNEMPQRLHEDHANARTMAEAIAAIEGLSVDLTSVETNIVFFSAPGRAIAMVAAMKAHGVLASAIGADRVRLVTHREVDAAMCMRAVDVVRRASLACEAAAA